MLAILAFLGAHANSLFRADNKPPLEVVVANFEERKNPIII